MLENASVNGTFVNHVAVDTAKLQDGDLISIGPKTYHLHISPVAERAHEEVTSAPGPAPQPSTRSTIVAIPCPTPMHIVQSA